jgi:signal transduction histidine kinase
MAMTAAAARKPGTGAGWTDVVQLAAAGGLCALLAFLVWEGVEQAFVHDDPTAHRVHYARGLSASVLTAAAVAWVGLGQHRRRSAGLVEEADRRAREAREARQLLEVIVDATPASLVVLDRSMRIVRANRMAERVHGRDLVGARCYQALAGRCESCTRCPALATFDDATVNAAPTPVTDPRTGEVLSVGTHPLRLEDGRDFVLIVERVITEQKKLQARLLHQEKMAAFGLLAAGVAHDMGNPLASIEAQLQLLDEGRLGEADGSVVKTVRQEVSRLGRTLREVVDFARRRRDEASLVAVQAVVDDALRILRHDPRMRRVQVARDFDSDTPSVFVVEDHLMQVVLNLLINAVDAMSAEGTLRIDLRGVAGQVALRIHDTGAGMDRTTLARCFEPLFTTKPPGKGTGLGLSVSRDILHAWGGDLEIHSAPQRGTTAVVTLPAAHVASTETRPRPEVRA